MRPVSTNSWQRLHHQMLVQSNQQSTSSVRSLAAQTKLTGLPLEQLNERFLWQRSGEQVSLPFIATGFSQL